MKILLVCLGNICRSPMAEGILQDFADSAALDLTLDSAGTGDWHVGEPPDKRAQENMKRNGHDISNLRARQFKVQDFDAFDRIYVMDKSNYSNVISLARSDGDRAKVSLFLDLSHPNKGREVPDPYFGGDQGFQDVYKLLSEATTCLIQELNGQ